MPKRLAINDSTAFAFGFAWQSLDPVESKSAKLTELMGQGNKWKASFKREGTEYLGVSKEDLSPLGKMKTLSGAALMAKHPKLAGRTVWIVMEEPVTEDAPDLGGSAAKVARSEIVIVGLVKGNIVIDDFVDSEGGYTKQWAVFVERCGKAKAQYTTVGTSYTRGKVAEQFTWQDFLPSKANKPVPVSSLEPSVYGRVVLAALVVAACSGIGWGYVAYHHAQQAKAERLRREREKRNLPAQYSESVSGILAQPMLRANTTFAELRHQLHRFPLEHKGWKLSKIECTAASAGCIATWSNDDKGSGTNRGFAEAAPKEWGPITFTADGKTASHAMPFKLATTAVPERNKWPRDGDFLMKAFSQWQSYWIVGFHPELDAAPHVIGLVAGLDEATAAELPDVVWARVWKIGATPWYLSDGFDRTADKGDGALPESVTVDRIDLKVDAEGQLKFDANGVIYESK
jgi:hypothetical protein